MALPDSDVDICNLALLRLGQDKITALTGTDNRSVACNEFYDQSRQEVLVMSRPGWNCAKKRAILSADSSEPHFDYDAKFRIPTDCLRVLYISDSNGNPIRVSWERREDYILLNDTDCYIVYIFNLENVDKMTPLLKRAIALKLAEYLCMRLKQSSKLLNEIKEELALTILLAEGVEASQKFSRDSASHRKSNKVLWVDEV